jgi:predicted permease
MAVVLAVDGAMIAAMTPLMMALGGSGRSDPAVLAEKIARRIFLNPLVLATIAGFAAALLRVRLPAPADGFLTLLRQAAPAVALFTLGAALPFQPIDKLRLEVPALLAVKLIGHPLIVYLLLSWVGGFDRIWVQTAVLLAALPPSVSVVALAEEHGIASDRIASILLLATVVSIATVTIVLLLLVSNVLPVRALR